MKILISDNLAEAGIRMLREVPSFQVDVKTGLAPDALRAIIGDYDALVIRSATKVTADIIEAARNLKVVARAGIGLDNVDIAAASKRGIVVMNAPEGNVITTAEHAIALILALSRNIPQAYHSMRAGKWEKKRFQGREVHNKVLGIIGIGRIGRIVAERAKGLRMNVIAYDPYISPDVVEELGIEYVQFDELLARADYITVHTPLTRETRGILNAEAFRKVKKGVYVINCARGGTEARPLVAVAARRAAPAAPCLEIPPFEC